MANINQIQSNLSSAIPNGSAWTSPYPTRQPTQAPIIPATQPPASPSSVIPQEIQKLNEKPLLVYPTEFPKYYMRLSINEYSRDSLMRLGTLNNVKNIILPLPLGLIDTQNVTYDADRLGTVTGPIASAINSIVNGNWNQPGRVTPNVPQSAHNRLSQLGLLGADAIGAGVGAAIGGVLGGRTGRVAGGVVGGLSGVVPGDFIANPIRAFSGITANPFVTVLLKGPEYRTFEFHWRFSPNNANESELLRQIRRDLNNYMAPGLALGGAIFTFPHVFKLAIHPNSKFMFKMKPAVLQSFSCNLTPGGQAAFFKARRGTDNLPAPEGIDISMRFLELEYVLQGDFKDSNDPYDFDTASRGGQPFPANPQAPGTPGGGVSGTPGPEQPAP